MPDERVLSGIGVTPRVGVGTARWHRPEIELSDPPAPETVDPEAERSRFETARDRAREAIERERDRAEERVGAEEAAVFDAHRQFLDDPQISEGVESALGDGLPAEHAVQRTFDRFVEQFAGMEGRMAERADDLRDLRDRLLRILTDATTTDLAAVPEGTVLLAERLTPSDTAALDPERVAGVAVQTGGRTSHAAIFARALALPAVVGVGDALSDVPEGAAVLVDGEAGEVVVDPGENRRASADESAGASVREGRVTTTDGRAVEVAANVGRPVEVDPAVERGADGIGLYRTEFLFLDRDAPPDEAEQMAAYRSALAAFPEGRVVCRTLDVGGDKPIPYLDLPESENPFLGERGIRRSLGPDADLFETQLRALLRAGAESGDDGGGEDADDETGAALGDLAVMLPMVSRIEEVESVLAVLESVASDLDSAGVPYAMPEFGVMVETPAAATLAGDLAERVDFLSIGTNDLTQYVMAASRGDERVAALHDPLYPAVLRTIRQTTRAADGTDCWVGMCGEMAGDPALTELLIGLGLDELSASVVTVPDVKARVSETDSEAARALAERALAAETVAEVREIVGIE
ncbi:phosphoenolpyruvate--protein phosphotransferase [Salinirubrum litoreum]|uniref:Phosphoenolpyruvate-protein phosphotransferase n=1 Tax=Salinirubrum litoreum TaxID=1126234 RepID=A0ABD5R9C5_9EURY|nr:phosphoenolpyruvate--protein phosphotransferase [Salinirubrum litoreum]